MEHKHGMKKHVVVRCDDESTSRGWTWDIWRNGRVVDQGLATRARARKLAARLNLQEELRRMREANDASIDVD